MRRATIKTAVVSAALLCLAAAPAFAGYGAFAVDQVAHKFGYSLNQPDQKHAEQLAIKKCNSNGCKVAFPVPPRQCAAFASSDEKGSTAWGGAVKPARDAAQSAAIQDCQKHTSGQCKVRASGCNR